MQQSTTVHRGRGARRAVLAVTASTALALGLLNGTPAAAAPKPPPPVVTQAQVDAAANNKSQLASLVGQINGQIAANRIALSDATAKFESAEQVSALRIQQQQQAEQAATAARAAVTGINAKAAKAHSAFVALVQSSYYGTDGVDGSTGTVLTAKNPSDVLDSTVLQQLVARNKAELIGQMRTVQIAKSNLEAKARQTAAKAKKAAAASVKALADADRLYKNTQAEKASLQSKLAGQQTLLENAQVQLATISGQRTTYLNYVAEQRRIAAAKALAAKLAAEKEAREAEAARRAEAAREARERAAQNNNGGSHSGSSNGGGGSSSGGGGGGSSSGPSAPSGGSWTAAKGRAAANRALSQLGVMYAWAGGNQYGATRGVCAGDGAWNDCHVIGFDCSGLAMYAWGQPWVHYTVWQYPNVGSYHPSVGNLMPGDLLFWSNGGTGGIHHVAIYIGGGRMVEAPESNVRIRTASIYEYGSIDYTTRPLT